MVRCAYCKRRGIDSETCDCLEATYRREMHKPPPSLPQDDPLAHQWSYRGTRAEREALAAELLETEPIPLIEGQESLI